MKFLKTYQLFERKQLGTLYHFTSLMNCYEIVENDRLQSMRELEREDKKVLGLDPDYGYYSFSFTRDKNLNKRLEQGQIDTPLTTRISIDGNRLSDNYKVKPYHWGHEHAKLDKHSLKHGYEAEEMIATTGSDIEDMHKFIIKIDLPTFEEYLIEYESYANGEPGFREKMEWYYKDFLEYEIHYDDLMEADDSKKKELYDELVDRIRHNYPN